MFSPASRGRLTDRDVDRFPDDTLFHRIARAVCQARCLPRKELYEAWETARRVRRLFRGGRVVDIAAGHGLLAHVMLLLDDTSHSALAVDTALPPSSVKLHEALVRVWPRLTGRISFMAADVEAVEILSNDVEWRPTWRRSRFFQTMWSSRVTRAARSPIACSIVRLR